MQNKIIASHKIIIILFGIVIIFFILNNIGLFDRDLNTDRIGQSYTYYCGTEQECFSIQNLAYPKRLGNSD